MYHNTNKESGKELKNSVVKAKAQEEIILGFFRATKTASPEDAWKKCFNGSDVPLTSVRRAISNLTKDGKLKKLESQVPGMYGKMISVWGIA